MALDFSPRRALDPNAFGGRMVARMMARRRDRDAREGASVNNFLIVGLPIVTAAASPEFRSFLTLTDVICVTSVGYDVTNWERSPDYVSAKAGHDLLLQHGFQFIRPWQFNRDSARVVVMLSLWQGPDGKRRSVIQVAALLSESIASV